jgi:hypothetical protein
MSKPETRKKEYIAYNSEMGNNNPFVEMSHV